MTEFIHLHLVTRINEYRRAHFFDHRRTFETIAGFKAVTQVNRAIHRPALENHWTPAALAALFVARR